MLLQSIDWLFIIAFFVISLVVGVAVSKRAGKSSSEFFLSGRNMPWWLLGVSMVATTFSTDTPNLVTDIVRQNGIAGNWVWWAFLLTGMLTVFVYAKLWRRSGVMTDIEFYELRYSGKKAAFLRGFRAIYLGVCFNVVVMASVTLAAIKIGRVMLGLSPIQTVSIAAVITVFYSTLGGLRSVLIVDFIQFAIAMFGAIMAAKISLQNDAIGGLAGLFSHADVTKKLSFIPSFSNKDLLVSVFIIPLAVQWWSVWYPGAEPGGGGYLVQRMLAAKNERNAMGATLLFNVAHYALRPWPWIIVALCSIVVFPDLQSLRTAFPDVEANILRHDLAYPAMLTYLPHGLLGLVVASLIAAYMSTISTHLNWGSSYVVNDFYRRFINTTATEKHFVLVGRIATVLLMVAACALAPLLENAKRSFDLILQIGAGTGLLFILRWFWWRINALSEITAMVVSFLAACYFEFVHTHIGLAQLESWQKLLVGISITTTAWVTVTFITKSADDETLFSFCKLVHAGGPGWKAVFKRADAADKSLQDADEKWDLPYAILCMVFGCLAVYASLFATGSWIYLHYGQAAVMTGVAVVSTLLLLKFWNKLKFK
jgi:SSS family solute:Na+ symporter